MSRPAGSVEPNSTRRRIDRQIADRRDRHSTCDRDPVVSVGGVVRVPIENQRTVVRRQANVDHDPVVRICRQNAERRRGRFECDRRVVASRVQDDSRDVCGIGDAVNNDRCRVRTANRQRSRRGELIELCIGNVEVFIGSSQSDRPSGAVRILQRDVAGAARDRTRQRKVGGRDHDRVVGNRDGRAGVSLQVRSRPVSVRIGNDCVGPAGSDIGDGFRKFDGIFRSEIDVAARPGLTNAVGDEYASRRGEDGNVTGSVTGGSCRSRGAEDVGVNLNVSDRRGQRDHAVRASVDFIIGIDRQVSARLHDDVPVGRLKTRDSVDCEHREIVHIRDCQIARPGSHSRDVKEVVVCIAEVDRGARFDCEIVNDKLSRLRD